MINWTLEKKALRLGYQYIAGVDEAGRGPLAGPIVACAVRLAHPVDGIDDSKCLSVRKREALYDILISGEHDVGIAIVDNTEIDKLGIQQANYQAMLSAISKLTRYPDLVLVDGYQLPGVACNAWRVVHGDKLSASIGAASIIAKVTRDRIMEDLDKQYPGYGFAKHKGYGTKEHLLAIARLGPSPVHRLSFAPFTQSQQLTLSCFDYSHIVKDDDE